MQAVVLLSGGLDSSVMLALALHWGRECHAVSFDYGQRHLIELQSASAIAKHYCVPHQIIPIELKSFNSSLLSKGIPAKNRTAAEIGNGTIPSTYVPARNTLFLAYALGIAESLAADEIYIGCNVLDAAPYPDCRPAFIQAFQRLIDVATKQSIEGRAPKVVAPLIQWNKQEIVAQGYQLNVPMDLTFSCYDPNPLACGQCDACILRDQVYKA